MKLPFEIECGKPIYVLTTELDHYDQTGLAALLLGGSQWRPDPFGQGILDAGLNRWQWYAQTPQQLATLICEAERLREEMVRNSPPGDQSVQTVLETLQELQSESCE